MMDAAERAEVLRSQQLRWQFLLELYRHNKKEVSAGHVQNVAAEEMGARIGLTDKRELQQVYEYLRDAGLLELVAFGPLMRITKRGMDEVEKAIREPDKQTSQSLPPLNIIHNVIHGGVHGSTVQQGTTESIQTVEMSKEVDWDGLRAILADIRIAADHAQGDQRDEILVEVATLEAQTRSPRPKGAIVKACLASLRSLVANTAGNIAAAPLIQWMQVHEWFLR